MHSTKRIDTFGQSQFKIVVRCSVNQYRSGHFTGFYPPTHFSEQPSSHSVFDALCGLRFAAHKFRYTTCLHHQEVCFTCRWSAGRWASIFAKAYDADHCGSTFPSPESVSQPACRGSALAQGREAPTFTWDAEDSTTVRRFRFQTPRRERSKASSNLTLQHQ